MKRIFVILGLVICVLQARAQSFTAAYDHSAVAVSNLDRSAAFYENILGLKEIPTPGNNPILRWFSVGGNHQLHLIKTDDKDIKVTKAIHLSLHVDDFEALLKFLNKEKVPYINWLGDSTEPSVRPDGVRQVYVQDPDGYWIELNDATY